MKIYVFTIGYYDKDAGKTLHEEGYVAAESFSNAVARVIETCTIKEQNASYCYISAYDEFEDVLFWDSIVNPREMMKEDCQID